MRGRFERCPGDGREFEAAEVGEEGVGRCQVRIAHPLHGRLHHRFLPGQSIARHAGARSDRCGGRRLCKGRAEGGGRCCIPDTHVAEPEGPHALVCGASCSVSPNGQRLCTLIGRHGGLHPQVPCAPPHLGVNDPVEPAQIRIHAHVNRLYVCSYRSAQHRNGRAAIRVHRHHLSGHVGWIGAHVVGRHAVIPGKHAHAPVSNSRPEGLLQLGEPTRNRLQLPKGLSGFYFGVECLLGSHGPGRGVWWGWCGHGLLQWRRMRDRVSFSGLDGEKRQERPLQSAIGRVFAGGLAGIASFYVDDVPQIGYSSIDGSTSLTSTSGRNGPHGAPPSGSTLVF